MLLSADIQGPTSTKAIGIVITWAGPDVHADQEDHKHGVGCMPRGPASWFAGEPHLHAKRCNAASLGRRRGPLGWTPRPSRLSVSGSLWLVSWPFCQSSRPVRASLNRVERSRSMRRYCDDMGWMATRMEVRAVAGRALATCIMNEGADWTSARDGRGHASIRE